MTFPVPSSDQYQRFRQEFAEYWNGFDHDPHNHIGDRTNMEETWCRARAYSEKLQGLTPMEIPA